LKSTIGNLKSRRQGGEIGGRTRLRITKSSISKHRFLFQNKQILRGENDFVAQTVHVPDGQVERPSF
jgi:hypothetical protein